VSQILPLRDYQRKALDALRADWADGIRRAAVVLPTGAGKTVVFAHLTAWWRANHRSRVLVVAHRDELVNQAAEKLQAIAPHLSVGIVKGARNEVNRDVIVASVQTLRSAARRERVYDVGLIIVDECHHATAPTYRAILAHYGAMGYDAMSGEHHGRDLALAAGFTATLARGDGASLGEVWQKVSYRRDILDMIRAGHLLNPRGKRVTVEDLDLDAVARRHGDYADGALGAALTASLAPEATAKAYLEHASDRSGVVFAPTVESAYAFAAAFSDAGIRTETVHGAQAIDERRGVFARAHDGATQVVTNCMVATEGTDVPRWSCAVIARPTQSAPLYVQMVGRVLRPFPGQTDALVLDVVGVTSKHQLRTIADLSGKTFREPPDEDELLTEASDREDAEELELGEERGDGLGGVETEYIDGRTVVREVDLFAGSRQQWLQTDGGAWFVPAGPDHFVFLAPGERPATFDVCWTHKSERRGGWTDHRGVELEYAMAWGEDVASEYHGFETYASKSASWRRGGASLKQKDYARGLGIIFAEDVTKPELANLITQAVASRRIDAVIKAMGRSA
jgi:superfamily II DNA or RNA helicase